MNEIWSFVGCKEKNATEAKKIENHMAAISLHYMNYNFARLRQSLRITPAMAADISNHVWSVEEIISLQD